MKKTGTVNTNNTVKAGCGIRYDPETLGEETGFDFTRAAALLEQQKAPAVTENKKITSDTLDGAVPDKRDGRN